MNKFIFLRKESPVYFHQFYQL